MPLRTLWSRKTNNSFNNYVTATVKNITKVKYLVL